MKTKPTRINTKTIWEWRDGEYVEIHNEGYDYSGPIAKAGGGSANTGTEAWRFYASDNSTAIANQDVDPVTLDVDTTYVVRVRVANTGTKDETADPYDIYYDNTTAASGRVAITASSADVQTADASGLTNGTAVTSGTLTGASGSFVNGEEVEDGISASITITQGNYTELWYSFTIVGTDVNDNDNIDLYIERNGTALDFDLVQSITVNKATVNEGTASFTGSGSLTATGQHIEVYDGTASFSGSGTLTATGQHILTYEGTASFSGSGTFTGTGEHILGSTTYDGTASFAGSGALSSSGAWTSAATASFIGAGTFSGTGSHVYGGTGAFAGSGSLTTTPNTKYTGTATFSGSGTLIGDGQHRGTIPGTASFTGSGTFTADGQGKYQASASFAGTGTFSGVGEQVTKYFATADFTGSGSFTAVGEHTSVAVDETYTAGFTKDPWATQDKLKQQHLESKKPKKRKAKSLPKAIKIGSYTQTKDHSEYSLKEAEKALKQLKREQAKAEKKRDEEILLKILIHIQIFEQHCQEIEEQDVAFIIAMLAA